MVIRDLFEKDITRSIQGVVTIGNEDEEQKWQELEEYVCTDEITKCFRTFFRKYRESIATPTEKMGVWITGFFGSGKSHFLKILGYILENEEVAGWEASRYFEEKISDEMILADIRQSAKIKNKVVLFNIDSKAKADSKNKSQAIMDIMLRAFNESVGYCGSQPWVADMERVLEAEGNYEAFVAEFERLSNRVWTQTRAKALLNKDYIVKALVSVRGMSEESAKQFVDDQTKNYTSTTEDFARIVNDYCQKNKTRVVFLMDEVGQFIGDNTQLMLNLQTCVEDLGKFCRGKAWVVVTSQQELKAMIEGTRDKQQDFSKIQGRFDTRLLLSGANADKVIKKRILDKKKNAENPLKVLYEANNNKLSNLILFPAKPTWSGYKSAEDFKEVYPFVSYQFELLQKVFESIREHGMSEGRHLSQNERSLLSAFQDSAKRFADHEMGILVPFDSFYQTVEQFIDYDVKTVFIDATKRVAIDEFALRVLKVLFMIKHVKEMPATIDRLATLLVESINEDKVALKDKIYEALKVLEAETFIQKNGEEYSFLTNEEQDVNKQINNTPYTDGEIQKAILNIIYENILDNNKLRYENRYEFGINRYVDGESKGAYNPENITIKILTAYSGFTSELDFQSESIRSNSIVVDLTTGSFIEELVRATKIAIFDRNNRATMSTALTEIMQKKSAERSERVRRAEDNIKLLLRTAPIYFNGQLLDIKQKDGKDRLIDALKEMVKQDYYKLNLVSYYYNDARSVSDALDDSAISMSDVTDISQDANIAAYNEIFEKIKNDRSLGRRSTVKSLVDFFAKKPYGWRDLDVLGMLACLWKASHIQFSRHDVVIAFNDRAFKTEYTRKTGLDTIVIKLHEKVSDEVLFQVKRIMNEAYGYNIPLDENRMKEEVISFFTQKKQRLSDIKAKYGSDYPGSRVVAELYREFEAILKSTDALTIFQEIIARKDSLIDKADLLEQLEAFYKDGSSQYKTYKEACQIFDWYNQNRLLVDLSKLDDAINRIGEIISMEMPFSKMSELATLVFNASEIKNAIVDEKYNSTVQQLEKDKKTIEVELEEALNNSKIPDDKKADIRDKADEILATYSTWFRQLNRNTENMDSYLTSSRNTVKGFRVFIENIISADDGSKTVRRKRVRIIDCVPVANKTISSQEDIDKVVKAIKEKLMSELNSNDEINLD